MPDEKIDIKSKFYDALTGLSVETKGIMSSHNETLTEQGVQQIWNALKLADLKIEEVKS